MLYLLFLSVGFTLCASFFCSLVEAVIYSVPVAYARNLAERGSKSGQILMEFKEDIGKPIAVILMLNTLANTAGPAITGYLVADLFEGTPWVLAIFSVSFAASMLFCGELLPKTLGAIYCRPISRILAAPLAFLIRILSPLLWLSRAIAYLLPAPPDEHTFSHEEVLSMANIGTEEGALDTLEGSVISNVIGLDKVLVKDVLTPRVVVFKMNENTKLSEAKTDLLNSSFSRIPIYADDDPDHLTGYITQRDAFRLILTGEVLLQLKEIARPLRVIPELMRVDKLLLELVEKKDHIAAVVDEHGSLAGIVSLEDILEEIIGKEIVDEYDAVSDLRSFAKILHLTKKPGQT